MSDTDDADERFFANITRLPDPCALGELSEALVGQQPVMRVVFSMTPDGGFTVATDAPCDVFIVNDHCQNDYKTTLSAPTSCVSVIRYLLCCVMMSLAIAVTRVTQQSSTAS